MRDVLFLALILASSFALYGYVRLCAWSVSRS